MAGFTEKRNGPFSANTRPFSLSNALKTLSSFGMRYDDMVLRQSQAIGPMEDQFGYREMNPFGIDNDDIYGAFAALSMADINMKKNVPFFDVSNQSCASLLALALPPDCFINSLMPFLTSLII